MGGKDLATCEQEREQAERSTGSSLDLSGSSDDDSGVGSGKDSGKGSGEGSGKGSDEVKDEDSDEVTDEDSDEVKDEDSDEVTDEDSDEEDSIGSEWSGGHTDQCKVDSDCVTKCESNPDFGGFSGTPGNAGGDGMGSSSPPPCSNDAGCKSLCEQMASQSGMSSAALGCDEVKCNLNTKTCSELSYQGGFGGHSGGFNDAGASSGFNTDSNAGGDGMDSSSPPPCSNDAGCKSLCEQMASQSGMSSAALGCDEVKCNLNTKTCSEPSYRGGFGGNSQPNFSGNSMQNFQGASGGRRLASSPDCKNMFCNSGMCQFKESNNWLSGSHEVSDEVSDEDSGKDPVQDTGSQSPDDPNDENTPSFNCLSREVWSEEKEEWCCTHENEGCKDEFEDIERPDWMKEFEECLESGKDVAECDEESETEKADRLKREEEKKKNLKEEKEKAEKKKAEALAAAELAKKEALEAAEKEKKDALKKAKDEAGRKAVEKAAEQKREEAEKKALEDKVRIAREAAKAKAEAAAKKIEEDIKTKEKESIAKKLEE